MRDLEKHQTQGEELQRQVLSHLLTTAKDTEYGRGHGFATIKGYEDFVKYNPVNTYEELKASIDRMRHGERDVLWPGRVKWYAKSSGTTNDKSKFIPVSDEGLQKIHYAGGFDSVALYLRNNPKSRIFDGRALILGGSHAPNYNLPGSLVGDLSAILIENINPLANLVRVPKKSTALLSDFEVKRDRIAREAMNKNVTNISGVPSWMLSVLNRMMEITGKTHLEEMWPNLEVFFHGGVAFTPYRKQYEQLITSPNMHYMETYNASEGFFGLQDDPADKSMLLMLDYGVFYEFQPMDGGDIVPLWAVEKDKNYAMLISTSCGLWRYMIGDTVRFTSTNPYKFVISGRTKSFINAFGEELIVDNAEQGLAYACEQTGAEVQEYTAAPVFMDANAKCRHQWLIEFSKPPQDLQHFSDLLDQRLQQLNSDYEAKRYKDITLQHLEIIQARPGLFHDWLKQRGKLGGQHKVPRLSNERTHIEQLLKLPLYLLAVLLLGSCARMGSPDGGWYDEAPPRIIRSSPAEQATNVTDKKIAIYFDEYIKLADPTQNVIVSPPQLEMPEIKAAGKKIVVELKDTLKANTTYTIDFSDAISDNNEDNPMGNYTYTFSTGEKIDTFEVAGYVIDASNLEPVKGISVGLYDDLADSTFRTKPLLRISRTDATGRFVIKGVAPGEYRVFALQDADGDFKFTQKSEMIAFSQQTYTTTAKPDIRQDTLWRDSLHIENIVQVPYTHFYPDDVVMLAFQEVQTDRYLLKTERKDADRINVFFSYGHPQLPVIRGLNFDADSAFVVETNARRDSITYWLRDTLLVNQDTLTFSMEYMMTDSLGQLVSQTDTIEALAKTPYAKRLKARQKEYDEWAKEQEKKKKREEPYDSIYPVKALEPRYEVPQSMDPGRSIFIEIPSPLARLDTAAIHLYSKIDTLWYRAPYEFQRCDSMLRRFELLGEWRPGTEYSFEVDSAAFTDIYGLVSKDYKQGLKVKSLDEYATILLQLSGLTAPDVVVQLLDKSDNVVMTTKMESDGSAQFFYVNPGTYYVRAFADRNNNGRWDTGNYDANLQPEDVYYYGRELEAKAKWDLTGQWNVTERPRQRQKPSVLVKQKDDKQKKQVRNRNAERARELGIEYIKKE